jgi:hypothetical protein
MTMTTTSAIADPVAVARFKALFGFEPSSTKRSVEEVDSLTVTVKKEERAQLKIDDRKSFDALQKRACAAIADKKKKFSIMAPKKGAEELKTVYDVTDTIETFGKECVRDDMHDVFRIVKPLTKSGDLVYLSSDTPSRTNLLEFYSTLTLEEVTLHCELILFYSKPFDVENLHWSADKLLASCDLELEKKVQEKIKLLPKWQHRCGPILFKVMMDLILLTNEDGIHAIINFVRNLKLKDQTGENVTEVASLLRGAVTFLQNNKAVPTDIMEVAHKIMRECSTDAFVSEIDCIYFNHRQQVKTITLNDFLTKCESSYRTLSTPNADGKIVWAAGTSRKKPAGGFHANGNQLLPIRMVTVMAVAVLAKAIEVPAKRTRATFVVPLITGPRIVLTKAATSGTHPLRLSPLPTIKVLPVPRRFHPNRESPGLAFAMM